jgi:hypothetical protein
MRSAFLSPGTVSGPGRPNLDTAADVSIKIDPVFILNGTLAVLHFRDEEFAFNAILSIPGALCTRENRCIHPAKCKNIAFIS